MFAHNNVIPLYRLVFLGILILLLRRIPVILALYRHIEQIEHKRHALFVGFFGPVGVSAIFYLYISLEFLREMKIEDETREDAVRLEEVMTVVVWFLAICSIVRRRRQASNIYPSLTHSQQVAHGLSIPVGKLGQRLPRAFGKRHPNPKNPNNELPNFQLRDRNQHGGQTRSSDESVAHTGDPHSSA